MYFAKLTAAALVAALGLVAMATNEASAQPKSAPPKAQSKTGPKVQYAAANRGAKVTGVLSGSPATDAGLEFGDVITHIDGTRISSTTHLTNTLAGKFSVTLTVVNVRNGETVELTAYPRNGKLGINVEIVDLEEAPPVFYSKQQQKKK